MMDSLYPAFRPSMRSIYLRNQHYFILPSVRSIYLSIFGRNDPGPNRPTPKLGQNDPGQNDPDSLDIASFSWKIGSLKNKIQGFPSALHCRSPWDSHLWFLRVLVHIVRVPPTYKDTTLRQLINNEMEYRILKFRFKAKPNLHKLLFSKNCLYTTKMYILSQFLRVL